MWTFSRVASIDFYLLELTIIFEIEFISGLICMSEKWSNYFLLRPVIVMLASRIYNKECYISRAELFYT